MFIGELDIGEEVYVAWAKTFLELVPFQICPFPAQILRKFCARLVWVSICNCFVYFPASIGLIAANGFVLDGIVSDLSF